MKHDTDQFNRWESAQKIYLQLFEQNFLQSPSKNLLSQELVSSLKSILRNPNLDLAMKCELIGLPSVDFWAQGRSQINGEQLQAAIDRSYLQVAQACEADFLEIYENLKSSNNEIISNEEFAKRRMKNRSLYYLSFLPKHHSLITRQFTEAKNMTDYQSAFSIIANLNIPERESVIDQFHKRWKENSLVLNKWFAVQASADHPDTLSRVIRLLEHPDFNIKNPNRVYSLLGAFGGNYSQFHRVDNNPYDFYAEQILKIDLLNPQVAARLAGHFDIWPQLEDKLKEKAQLALEKMLKTGLSKNTHEIVKNNLEAGS